MTLRRRLDVCSIEVFYIKEKAYSDEVGLPAEIADTC